MRSTSPPIGPSQCCTLFEGRSSARARAAAGKQGGLVDLVKGLPPAVFKADEFARLGLSVLAGGRERSHAMRPRSRSAPTSYRPSHNFSPRVTHGPLHARKHARPMVGREDIGCRSRARDRSPPRASRRRAARARNAGTSSDNPPGLCPFAQLVLRSRSGREPWIGSQYLPGPPCAERVFEHEEDHVVLGEKLCDGR